MLHFFDYFVYNHILGIGIAVFILVLILGAFITIVFRNNSSNHTWNWKVFGITILIFGIILGYKAAYQPYQFASRQVEIINQLGK